MTVKIYSTPSCPWCTRVKEYLNSKNVDFVDYDVSSDREKAMEMVTKSGQRGVPVVEIENNIIIGFDQQNIDKLLNL